MNNIKVTLNLSSSATTAAVLGPAFIHICGESSVNKTLTSTSPLYP